jgi:hypothetical protein
MDAVVGAIVETRYFLRHALGLDQMMMNMYRPDPHWLDRFGNQLRNDRVLGSEVDRIRQLGLDSMNEILAEANLPQLKRIGEWS